MNEYDYYLLSVVFPHGLGYGDLFAWLKLESRHKVEQWRENIRLFRLVSQGEFMSFGSLFDKFKKRHENVFCNLGN